MGFEYELKFCATPAQQQAIRESVACPGQTIAMETTYYDTPSASLSSRHITLRRRKENGVSVCTVKTPAGGAGRGEWECRRDDIEASISELCKLGAPKELLALTAEGLIAVCGARFTRTAYAIALSDGEIELALDSGVLTGGGREIPLCEVEVELKDGPKAVADTYAASLAAQFGLVRQPKSKFRRALDLYRGE